MVCSEVNFVWHGLNRVHFQMSPQPGMVLELNNSSEILFLLVNNQMKIHNRWVFSCSIVAHYVIYFVQIWKMTESLIFYLLSMSETLFESKEYRLYARKACCAKNDNIQNLCLSYPNLLVRTIQFCNDKHIFLKIGRLFCVARFFCLQSIMYHFIKGDPFYGK